MADQTTHGGKRRNAGRKTERELQGEPCMPVLVSLDQMTVRKLKVLGGGNVSLGVRVAARIAFDKYQRSPEIG